MVMQNRDTMSEATPASIALAAQYAGTQDTSEATTEPIVDETEDQVEELDESTTEDTEESNTPEEEELPDAVKDILKKNRKEVREANARAVAAEKALAAKNGTEEAAPSEADSKFKELYLNSAAKTALVEAGITTGTDRFVKMLDLSSVEVDESGKISGLEDQIASLKEDFADVLTPKPVRKSVGNTDGARKAAPSVPKSSADRIAAMLRG
jgi:hypothetical protein